MATIAQLYRDLAEQYVALASAHETLANPSASEKDKALATKGLDWITDSITDLAAQIHEITQGMPDFMLYAEKDSTSLAAKESAIVEPDDNEFAWEKQTFSE